MAQNDGMDLGRVGIWTRSRQPIAGVPGIAAELEALGYGALWIPEAVGRDPFVTATLLLGGRAARRRDRHRDHLARDPMHDGSAGRR